MAAIPQSLITPTTNTNQAPDHHRRSTSSTRRQQQQQQRSNLSHGRGGAGNIGGATASDLEPPSLETPTLKGEVYTTGRGGSGNMTRNDDPEAARRAQDVVGTPRRESASSTHVGRGGAANVFRPSAEDLARAKEDNARWEGAVVGDEDAGRKKNEKKKEMGLADRGKEWLFGGRKS